LPHAKIVWNPNLGQNDPRPYYPGDDLVDIIGIDVFFTKQFAATLDGCLERCASWRELGVRGPARKAAHVSDLRRRLRRRVLHRALR
jgi:hypothetical protein